MMNPDTENTDSIDQGFFGHPKGLRTLFFTELWERMSYYGMRGLLVLYMTVGVTGNPGLDWSNAEANAIYGIYAGMVYFLALPGGWLADNLLGYQRAVLFGALIIMLGHFTLAIPLEQTFILGLILVAAGTGLLKPNISSIVGQLYSTNDDRRDSGFTIFYMSINIGSMLGFAVCGWLGEKVGWHWGFGAAGFGMLLGVIQFIYFRGQLGEAGLNPNPNSDEYKIKLRNISLGIIVLVSLIVLSGLLGWWSVDAVFFAERFRDFLVILSMVYFAYLFLFAGLNSAEKRNVLMLLLLFIGAAAFWSGFDQSAGSLTIFTRDYVDLTFGSFTAPVSWTQFANPLFVVMFAPFFAYIWVFLGKRNLNPNTPVKFAIGLIFMALGFIIMLLAVEYALVSSPVGVQWLLLTYLLHTFGELALSPVGLSAFSKYSPKRYLGQMMGLWFLASSLGGVLAGLFGGEATSTGLDSMTPIFSELVYYYLVLAVVLIVLSFFIKGKVEE
jgi:POT family proton-dependent oligopeptide transporter